MIRLAKITDLNSIMNIIEATRPLLLKQGSKQWNTSDNYPNLQTFTNDINNNILFVVENKKIVNGVFAITNTNEDNYETIFKGQWLTTSTPYIAIHRLAISPTFYNRGLASEVINFAKEYAKKLNFKSIKVDTHPLNKPMNKLLIKSKFTLCGEIHLSRTTEDNIRIAYEYTL